MRGNNIVKYIFGTRKKKQGALLDIPVLDHIIIAREGYVSFKETYPHHGQPSTSKELAEITLEIINEPVGLRNHFLRNIPKSGGTMRKLGSLRGAIG